MTPRDTWLLCEDANLLAECNVYFYKSSGPGGQHRNKTSSAVRLHHRPSGVSAHGDESRSQHENKRLAVKRLRMNIACRCRQTPDPTEASIPPVVAECLHAYRRSSVGPGARDGKRPANRLTVGRRDHRFWPVAAFVLDLLDANTGRLAQAAMRLGISTGNLSAFLTSERHLLAAAQAIRKTHAQKPHH
ncbi:MAG: peptide chain release factor-like protein [Phycisphaerae bacterium]|nr:peptide chain release factor-like protein [Phycisphaerae bacterium]